MRNMGVFRLSGVFLCVLVVCCTDYGVICVCRGVLGVLWDFCILGDIIYRFDKQSVLKRLKIGFFKIGDKSMLWGVGV